MLVKITFLENINIFDPSTYHEEYNAEGRGADEKEASDAHSFGCHQFENADDFLKHFNTLSPEKYFVSYYICLLCALLGLK